MTITQIRFMLKDLQDRVANLERINRVVRRLDTPGNAPVSPEDLRAYQIALVKKKCEYNVRCMRKAAAGEHHWKHTQPWAWALENDGWLPLGRAFEGLDHKRPFLPPGKEDKLMPKVEFMTLIEKLVKEETDWQIKSPSASLAAFGSFKTYVRVPFQESEK